MSQVLKSEYEIQTAQIHKLKDNDGHIRMNYLYQAAHLMHTIPQYSQYLMQQCKSVGSKKVTRMTADMKKSHCKKCEWPLMFEDMKLVKQQSKLFMIKQCPNCQSKNRTFIKKLQ